MNLDEMFDGSYIQIPFKDMKVSPSKYWTYGEMNAELTMPDEGTFKAHNSSVRLYPD